MRSGFGWAAGALRVEKRPKRLDELVEFACQPFRDRRSEHVGEGLEIPELLGSTGVESIEGLQPLGAEVPDEFAEVVALVAGGDQSAGGAGPPELLEIALLAFPPGTLAGAGLRRRRVGTVENDPQDGRAKARLDPRFPFRACSRIRGILERVVKQRGDRFVGPAAGLDHEPLDPEQMGDIGDGFSLSRLVAMPFPGESRRLDELRCRGGECRYPLWKGMESLHRRTASRLGQHTTAAAPVGEPTDLD